MKRVCLPATLRYSSDLRREGAFSSTVFDVPMDVWSIVLSMLSCLRSRLALLLTCSLWWTSKIDERSYAVYWLNAFYEEWCVSAGEDIRMGLSGGYCLLRRIILHLLLRETGGFFSANVFSVSRQLSAMCANTLTLVFPSVFYYDGLLADMALFECVVDKCDDVYYDADVAAKCFPIDDEAAFICYTNVLYYLLGDLANDNTIHNFHCARDVISMLDKRSYSVPEAAFKDRFRAVLFAMLPDLKDVFAFFSGFDVYFMALYVFIRGIGDIDAFGTYLTAGPDLTPECLCNYFTPSVTSKRCMLSSFHTGLSVSSFKGKKDLQLLWLAGNSSLHHRAPCPPYEGVYFNIDSSNELVYCRNSQYLASLVERKYFSSSAMAVLYDGSKASTVSYRHFYRALTRFDLRFGLGKAK